MLVKRFTFRENGMVNIFGEKYKTLNERSIILAKILTNFANNFNENLETVFTFS